MDWEVIMDLNKLAAELHMVSKANGHWAKGKYPDLGTAVTLAIGDLAEIIKRDQKGVKEQVSDNVSCINHFEEKLADAVIRCLDIAAAYKLDIEMAVKSKALLNKARIPHSE
jgi:hypothetical protein